MSNRLLQAAIHKDRMEAVCKKLDELEPRNWWRGATHDKSPYEQVFIVIHDNRTQEVMDAIHDLMEDRSDWRLVVIPLHAVAPEIEDEEQLSKLQAQETTGAREEIYDSVEDGAALNIDMLLMTALSAVVAAIGLNSDDLAVVIGAMVIAPLLGPIMAFAFGTALGSRRLLWSSAKSMVFGLGVAMAVAVCLGFVLTINIQSGLLDFSSSLGLSRVALPLASGAAAALMIARGQSSPLIGVMVAAALLPPIAAFGLLLGGGEYDQALRALVLLTANIVSITLAAQLVFLWKGIRPRKWLGGGYQSSLRLNIGIWASLLASIIVYLMWEGESGWTLLN